MNAGEVHPRSVWDSFDIHSILGDPGAASRTGRKGATKVSSTGGKAPGYRLSLDHFQTVKRMLAPDWAQKMLCIIVPNRRTASISWVLFVSSYTTAIDSITACLAHAPKKCTQSWNVQFDVNSPFQNTVYPKTKDSFPKTKLELTTGIHACIDHAFVNVREFKMPRQLTATKTSHWKWIHIFSVSIAIIPTRLLCQRQANCSGAESLSTISKFIKRKEIFSLLVYVLHKTWN